MKVRLIFQCSRCGSISFRPSRPRSLKDGLLRLLGVHPQRCYLCRRRFYLFQPAALRTFLAALDAHPTPVEAPELEPNRPRLWARQDSNV